MSDTTLVAIRTDTGARITVDELPMETVRMLSEGHQLRCPQCGSLLTFKAGPVRVHHFAHVTLEDCAAFDHEPETDDHRQGKLILYQQFRQGAVQATLEQHLPATDQRADVFIELPETGSVDGAERCAYALEFQQANNSATRWMQRHSLYQDQNIHDIWFMGQVRYNPTDAITPISPYDPLPVPRHAFEAASGLFRVRDLEKAILNVEPILYYLDPVTAILTILLARDQRNNTLRAYQYCVVLADCALRAGRLWTPLDPLLADYYRYVTNRQINQRKSKRSPIR